MQFVRGSRIGRVTFSCESDLKKKLTEKANKQGIPRSQLIVELLEFAMNSEETGIYRGAEVNRFLFDVQQRIAELEVWRREINEWKTSASENTDNLESTIATILNEQLTEVNISSERDQSKKGSIPTPKK